MKDPYPHSTSPFVEGDGYKIIMSILGLLFLVGLFPALVVILPWIGVAKMGHMAVKQTMKT